MIGAIIGDIVGSRFEFNNHRSKEFELFTEEWSDFDKTKVYKMNVLFVMIGGFFGAISRFALGEWIHTSDGFPLGTLFLILSDVSF